jgi:hypothetical protein
VEGNCYTICKAGDGKDQIDDGEHYFVHVVQYSNPYFAFAILDAMSNFFTHHFYAGARVEAQAGAVGQALEGQGLLQGTMLSGSKSYYQEQHPDHKVFFNGCIFIKEPNWVLWRRSSYRQIWWGDIDLTESRGAVIAAADACGQDLWVTLEKYRWDGYHGEDEGAVYFKANDSW